MRIKRFVFLLAFLLPILSACQNNDTSQKLADELPLDDQRPTFAFFFTDG